MIASSDLRRIDAIRKTFRASPAARLAMWSELAVLSRQYDIVRSLALIEKAYAAGTRRKLLHVSQAASVWRRRIENNEPFGTVVTGWVSPRERMFAAVAHNRPNFGDIIEQMHTAEELLGRLKAQWLKSMVEPAFMILWTWAILVYFAHTVLTQFAQFPTKPRGLAITAMNIAHWLYYWGSWAIPGALLAIGTITFWRMRTWFSRSRLRIEEYWPFSLYKALHAADFLIALSVLQACGDDLSTSLLTMSKTADPYLRWQIAAIEPLLRTRRLSDATAIANRDFPDAMVNARLDIALEDHPDNFPGHLRAVSDDFNKKLAARLDDNAQTSKFILVVVIGIIQVGVALLTLSTALVSL